MVKKPMPDLKVSHCQHEKTSKVKKPDLTTLRTLPQVDQDHQSKTSPTARGPNEEVISSGKFNWRMATFYDVFKGHVHR